MCDCGLCSGKVTEKDAIQRLVKAFVNTKREKDRQYIVQDVKLPRILLHKMKQQANNVQYCCRILYKIITTPENKEQFEAAIGTPVGEDGEMYIPMYPYCESAAKQGVFDDIRRLCAKDPALLVYAEDLLAFEKFPC